MQYIYKAGKLTEPMKIDADWNKPQWQNTETAQLKLHMGEKPAFMPKTQTKLMYDDENIYMIFKVEDKFVRSVAAEMNGDTWMDSCVEFFFSPKEEPVSDYFSLETNCCGTMLFRHQKEVRKHETWLEKDQFKHIEIASTFKGTVEPEITEPVTWYLEYRIPVEVIEKFTEVQWPKPGVKWRGNFFKIGEGTSNIHYITWTKVDLPKPEFHAPKFFGTIEFVE